MLTVTPMPTSDGEMPVLDEPASGLDVRAQALGSLLERGGVGGALASVLVAYAVGVTLALLVTRTPQDEPAPAPETAG